MTLEGMEAGRVWVEVKSRSVKRRPQTSSEIKYKRIGRQTCRRNFLRKEVEKLSVKTPVADLGFPRQRAPNAKGRGSDKV